MRPRWARPGQWTLRSRLVAGLLATLTVACAAVGMLTYVHLREIGRAHV